MPSLRSFDRQPRGVWRAVVLALSVVLPATAAAQVPVQPPGNFPPGQMPPSPEQAREMLRQRPELAEQIRQRIGASGLTPDQVRARLRALGYPEDLLDPYLTGRDTLAGPLTGRPGARVVDAVRALGILSDVEADSLLVQDSIVARTDSLQQLLDSLLAHRADSLRADSLADSISAIQPRGLRVFGLEVFRRASTRFQPTLAGPVDAQYRLGPGDVLVLILTGDVEAAHTLEVTREGFVVVPQVGQIYVANLTLGQLEDQLYARLGRVYSGVRRGPNATTRFQISVARLRTIQVYVVGDVARPGAYQISAAGTVLTALYAAGGPSANGSFRRVDVRRGGQLLDSLDLYDYLLRGIVATSPRLENGDVVFVPVHGGRVDVAGEVVRPAIYEVKPDETLADVLQFAGGFGAAAFRARAQIHRVYPDGSGLGAQTRVVVDVGPDQFVAGAVPRVPIAAGDSVTVFAVAERLRRYVTVQGNVWVEGQVGFAPGMRLSEAIRLAGGPKPDVYLDRILITRVRDDSSLVQLRSAFADTTGRVVNDLVLEDEDEIRVFSRTTFRPERYVTITGAVRKPGRVPYREGMTLRDAILLAQGTTEDAYLREAEIARLADDPATGSIASTVRVPLDSSYAFGRAIPGGDGGPAGAGNGETVLEPYDNVLVMRRPGWELQRLVYLSGEVRFPGRYALQSKTERLADLIERAGGLTDEAYPDGVEFYRASPVTRRDEQRAGAPASDRLRGDLPRGVRERVGVDLARVLKDPEFRDNLILAAGDSLFIPEFDPIVMVEGGVNAPGAVAYRPGASLDEYVRSAGGYAASGDRGRAYVTQPNGKIESVQRRFLLPDGVPDPRPGAVVYVPTADPRTPSSNWAQVLGTAASLVASLVTVVVVLRNN